MLSTCQPRERPKNTTSSTPPTPPSGQPHHAGHDEGYDGGAGRSVLALDEESGQQGHRPHLGQGRRRQRDAPHRRHPIAGRPPAHEGEPAEGERHRQQVDAGQHPAVPQQREKEDEPRRRGAPAPPRGQGGRHHEVARQLGQHQQPAAGGRRPVALDRLEGEVRSRAGRPRSCPGRASRGSATSSRYWRWSPVVKEGCSQSVASITRTPARRWMATSAPMAQRQRSIAAEPNGARRCGWRGSGGAANAGRADGGGRIGIRHRVTAPRPARDQAR